MHLAFGIYEHTTIGFPGVKLKWCTDNGHWGQGYITVKGIITDPWSWSYQHPGPFSDYEMNRFDEWVRARFADDPSVQG
jgi:hypothetical protein